MYHSDIIFLSQLHDRFLKHNNPLQSFNGIPPGYKMHSATDRDIEYLIETYQEDLDNSDLVIIVAQLWREKCDKRSFSTLERLKTCIG